MNQIPRIVVVALAVLLAAPGVRGKNLQVDVAPFARPLAEADAAGLEWPEMRRIALLEVNFAPDGPAVPSAEAMQVEYWHRVWNGGAIRRYGEQGAGRTGWVANDDWYNGSWKKADARVEIDRKQRRATFRFLSSELKEFPELKTKGVTYRPTLKMRVKFSTAHPLVASLRAFTDSTLRSIRLVAEFDGRKTCDDPVEVYNGWMVEKSVSAANQNCAMQLALSFARNSEDDEADRTIVTVRSARSPFSFAVDDVERGERIYIKDLGVLIRRADDPITLAEYRRVLEESGAKSVYDRVFESPEQTLAGAWRDMPRKQPYYFILGLEGARQRFRVDPTGDLWVNHPNFSKRRPGKDTGHFLWPDGMAYQLGLPEVDFAERTLAEGYLPIVTTRWLSEGLLYEQEAFADALAANLNSAPPMQGDDAVVAFVKLRIVNTSGESKAAHLHFTTSHWEKHSGEKKKFEVLRADGDQVLGSYDGRDVLRFLVDIREAGRLANSSDGVRYELDLGPHQEHTFYLKIPFITLTETQDIEHLRSLSPEREREEVARFWRNRVASGTEILTPEPWLNDFYKAHLTHLLINNEREIGADRYMARVGSFYYGAYSNESTMMITDLDRRGYSKEAERSLDLFLHYQGTVPLPGNFRSRKGIFYGAGGYEHGDYNQHHGWTLWGMAEHYWYTRDRAWMERAAPHLIEAARWIVNERQATMKKDSQGRPVPEYGLLPAGSLEDVRDFWYWLSTNAFSWWGLDNAARALRDFGHPEGAELEKEAESYRQDVLRAFREASVRAPVVALRDGTYIPHVPSNVYTWGRAHGWLRETLEGAIMLVVTRLMDPASREAEWILKDYEDNRYISDRFGYSIPVFDQFWFSRGGFSMQPNLLHGPLPYLYRDEIKHFLRAYFNGFASAYDPTLRMLCEHPLPELGYIVGDHFKSSDEAQSTYWLRLMFVSELGDTLHLGRALPRYWLRDGESIVIRNASTYFGKLSYQIRSRVNEGRIEMLLDPPERNLPKQIVVRFRHPQEKPIRNVTVNGQPWKNFDATKGDIYLPGNAQPQTRIVADY